MSGNLPRAIDIYLRAKQEVIANGWGGDIDWQESVRLDDVTEQSFLRDVAFVILNSGMRAAVILKHWPALREVFYDFASAVVVKRNHDEVRAEALRIINSPPKIDAILDAANRVDIEGWRRVFQQLHGSERDVLRYLSSYRYIGPVIMYHLAKNLGVQVAKPDRHLMRIAEAFGFDTRTDDNVQPFCRAIAEVTGDSIPVVDIVWWRWATIEPAYLERCR